MVVNVTHDKSIAMPLKSHPVLNINVGFKNPQEHSLSDGYAAQDVGNQCQVNLGLCLPYVVLPVVIAHTGEQTGW